MWVFCNDSFVSAVQHLDDPNLLVVRARVEGDLERFFERWGGPKVEVERHEDRDYLFRTIVSKEQFATEMRWHIGGIDYPNFKDSIAANQQERHIAYLRVWAVMNDLQNMLYGVGAYAWSRLAAVVEPKARRNRKPVRKVSLLER